MYGTLRGPLAGRQVAFDRESFRTPMKGHITGIGRTIRIRSIHVNYDVAVPPERARRRSSR